MNEVKINFEVFQKEHLNVPDVYINNQPFAKDQSQIKIHSVLRLRSPMLEAYTGLSLTTLDHSEPSNDLNWSCGDSEEHPANRTNNAIRLALCITY